MSLRFYSTGKGKPVSGAWVALVAVSIALVACSTRMLSADVRRLALDLEVGMNIEEVTRLTDALALTYGTALIYEKDAAPESYRSVERACRAPESDAVCVPGDLADHLSSGASGRVTEKAMWLGVLGKFPYGFVQTLTVYYDISNEQVIGWIY